MKKLAVPMLAIALGLTACGQSDAPAAEEGGTVVKEGEEWTADAQQPGAVDVKLPDTPVVLDKADSAAEAGAEKK